jgi:hypothetical protein
MLGTPIPSAEVSLVDTAGVVVARAVSDTAGVFALLGLRLSDLRLYAEALGYLAIVEGPLDLRTTDLIEVEVALRAIPIEVEGLSVTVEGRSRKLGLTGFYDRLMLGQGYHFDRAALLERGEALLVSDWLRGIPGVSVDNVGRVRLRGISSLRGCPYRVLGLSPNQMSH